MSRRLHILFVADGRSPIALNWIQHFTAAGHTVDLATTYACPPLPGAAQRLFPVALGELGGSAQGSAPGRLRRLIPVGLRTWLRQRLGPLTLPSQARRLAGWAAERRPDLIHAMRIPFEGMLAANALEQLTAPPPLLISIWGNDFTLHAPASPWLGAQTRRALRAAAGLHADCRRDVRLAYEWGFVTARPAVVLPGGGGVQVHLFHPPAGERDGPPVVINPRGLRAYVRSDTFFQSIPRILAELPETRFTCPGMAGQAEAQGWVQRLGLEAAVSLLPPLSRPQMAEAFRTAWAAVSPSVHDGTPNTLLEAMACGCYPVAGDLESLREWITPGENGALVHPGDPAALAAAVVQALRRPELRRAAQEINTRLIAERAEYGTVMRQAEAFYEALCASGLRGRAL
jgi:glycosyltransferase involved in cell wall biosynthesis